MTCIHPKKTVCDTSKFDVTTTGMSYYDAMIGKGKIVDKYKDNPKEYFKNVKGIDFEIECITPDEYFIEVAKFNGTTPEDEKNIRIIRDWVEDYKNKGPRYVQFCYPTLLYLN